MSGPPWWLAYACIASLWVAAGCVGAAALSALLDACTDIGDRDRRTATEATHTERTRT